MGVTIIARPQLRARLEKPNPGASGAPGTPAPAAALPLLTYDAPMTFHMNGEHVQLIPIRQPTLTATPWSSSSTPTSS